MPRNITRTGKKSLDIAGIAELQKKIRDMVDATAGDEARAVSAECARDLEQKTIAAARAVNVPHEVFEDIFSYAGRSQKKSLQTSAIVGIRKRGRSRPWAEGYAEWRNRAAYTRIRFKGRGKNRKVVGGGVVGVGDLVGESLATMWEIGTSKQPAKPFFRPTVAAAQPGIIAKHYEGYKKIIERNAR